MRSTNTRTQYLQQPSSCISVLRMPKMMPNPSIYTEQAISYNNPTPSGGTTFYPKLLNIERTIKHQNSEHILKLRFLDRRSPSLQSRNKRKEKI